MKKLRRPAVFLAGFILVAFAENSLGQGTGNDVPNGAAGNYNGMIGEGVDPYSGNGRRRVEDLSVAGSVGAYPLKWVRTLNTMNGVAIGQFGNGGTWRHSYAWSLGITIPAVPDPHIPPEDDYMGPEATVYFPDGKIMRFFGPTEQRGVPWHSDGTALAGEPDGPGEKCASLAALGMVNTIFG